VDIGQTFNQEEKHIYTTAASTNKIRVIDQSTVEVTQKNMNAKPDEILSLGKDGLRCVEAKAITYDLLKLGTGKTNTFELSKPCTPGEIDFFVSHSW
jgi:hypothetical protein